MKHKPNLTIHCPIFVTRGRASQIKLDSEPPPEVPEPGNIPRASRLMALAIKLERDLKKGKVKDLADIARLGGITRARATQIMNLLNLAPDIQERILFLPRTKKGRAPITTHELGEIAAHVCWLKQREIFYNRWSDLPVELPAEIIPMPLPADRKH